MLDYLTSALLLCNVKFRLPSRVFQYFWGRFSDVASYLICYILLTAIGLTSSGSSTVHNYTQTIHRTTQWNRTHRTERT